MHYPNIHCMKCHVPGCDLTLNFLEWLTVERQTLQNSLFFGVLEKTFPNSETFFSPISLSLVLFLTIGLKEQHFCEHGRKKIF